LIEADEDYNCFGEVRFRRVEGFKMEQRAEIKFYVKLNKTATETFEMLKSAYGEECLLRMSAFEWHKMFKEGRESLQDDEWKGRVSTSRTEEFVPEKQTVRSPTDCV
jgi:hypothetical protein